MRLLRLDNIFITALTPDCLGGLPGKALFPSGLMIHTCSHQHLPHHSFIPIMSLSLSYTGMLLTLADGKKTAITIHGPEGLRSFLRSTQHFMRR